MWLTTIVLILVALAVCVAGAFVYGASRWQGKTKDFRARLEAARMPITPAAAQGELLRYLAEAAWYPTALLPNQGVRWEAMDDSAARATLTDGATTVSLEFCFDSEGLITSLKAASRYHGEIDGVPEFAPWHGRFWAYEVRDGMRIPLEGKVAWQLPAGLFPYYRVRIREISYEFAR